MISPNLSTPTPHAETGKGALLLASPASSTTSSTEEASHLSASEAATHLAEKVKAVAELQERTVANAKAAAIKMSNFSIAALINKDSEAEQLERRRRLVESVPMLGKRISLEP